MTAAAVRATSRRPVRVVIEGEAYNPTGDDSVLIVVRKDGGKIVFPSKAEGVTVEDIVPPRTWTDGDVVQNQPSGWTLTRHLGEWVSSMAGVLAGTWSDARVTKHLGHTPGWGQLEVLRYQAGDQ